MDDTTQLDWVYAHERERPEVIWLTQPMGGGAIRELTFAQALDEARRMATYLVGLGLPSGARVAIFSKNTAWWLLADLAIWMAGHVSVPIYPTASVASSSTPRRASSSWGSWIGSRRWSPGSRRGFRG